MKLINEIWKPTHGYSGYYISTRGRLSSKRQGTMKILGGSKTDKGYIAYKLRNNGKQCREYAHRMVLQAFRGIPHSSMTASHIDGNPENNHINNLIWETLSDNCMRRADHGTDQRGERSCVSKLKEKDVLEIRERHERGETQTALSKIFGVHHTTIHYIIKGKLWNYT